MDDLNTEELMRLYNKKLSEYCDIENEIGAVEDPAVGLKLVGAAIALFPVLNRLLQGLRTKGVDVKSDQVYPKGFIFEPQQSKLAV